MAGATASFRLLSCLEIHLPSPRGAAKMKSTLGGAWIFLLACIGAGCQPERYASTLPRRLSEIPAEQQAELQPYLIKADRILNQGLKNSSIPAVDVNGRQLTSDDYDKCVGISVFGSKSSINIYYDVRVYTDGVGFPNGPMVSINPITGETEFFGGR